MSLSITATRFKGLFEDLHDKILDAANLVRWASRWNANVPLINGQSKLSQPAPRWSRSGRWRETIKEGGEVEVRDSSSIAERPKWYRGIVKKVGVPGDPTRDMSGGADLETFRVSSKSDAQKPLLVLGRQQQVLVEVKQVLRKVWSGDHSELAPRLLKQTLGAFAPQLNNCYQHDSQEFCQFLMDGLHEDLNRRMYLTSWGMFLPGVSSRWGRFGCLVVFARIAIYEHHERMSRIFPSLRPNFSS
jgi:hypothetical protein